MPEYSDAESVSSPAKARVNPIANRLRQSLKKFLNKRLQRLRLNVHMYEKNHR